MACDHRSVMTSRKDLVMSMTPFGQDKFISINGLQLHYVEWGSPGNPALVLLHGFQSNAHTWDTFSQAMADTYHVLALDQRGHRMVTMPRHPRSVTSPVSSRPCTLPPRW